MLLIALLIWKSAVHCHNATGFWIDTCNISIPKKSFLNNKRKSQLLDDGITYIEWRVFNTMEDGSFAKLDHLNQ